MERVEAIVVGAGVVGLAVARALALAGRETVVLEAAGAVGTGTSSRNSEVVHAGLYYPPGSLKAVHCVRGKHLIYDHCAARGIAAPAIGKLLVATEDAQRETLARIARNAEASGVEDLVRLDAAEAKALEPELACVEAILSPSSGIVDSHAFMLSLQGEFEDAGGVVVLATPVEKIAVEGGGFTVVTGGAVPFSLGCDVLVNAAGLGAPDLARTIGGETAQRAPRAYFAKGSYFGLTGVRAPFKRLVYPIPEAAGLGIHATVDLAGQVRFGPDVEWIDRLDYAPSTARLPQFEAAIRTYWPGLPDGALIATYAGVRPKITGPGEPAADFVVQGPAEHGVPGLVNLFGIESPGLTASLSLAEAVRDALEGARVAVAA